MQWSCSATILLKKSWPDTCAQHAEIQGITQLTPSLMEVLMAAEMHEERIAS